MESVDPLIVKKVQEQEEKNSGKKVHRTINTFINNEWATFIQHHKSRTERTLTEIQKVGKNLASNFNCIASVLNTVVARIDVIETQLTRLVHYTITDRRHYNNNDNNNRRRYRAQSEYR